MSAISFGLTPEMLPVVVTTSLAKGAMKMVKHRVIVKVPVGLVRGGASLTNVDRAPDSHAEDPLHPAYCFTACTHTDGNCDAGRHNHSLYALWHIYWPASVAPHLFPLVDSHIASILWADTTCKSLVSQAYQYVALT